MNYSSPTLAQRLRARRTRGLLRDIKRLSFQLAIFLGFLVLGAWFYVLLWTIAPTI